VAVLERRSGTLDRYRPPGQCLLRFDHDGILVERADEHVWLADEFLNKLVTTGNPWVNLTWGARDTCVPSNYCCQVFRGGRCYAGAVVAIWAKNGAVIYRIGGFTRGQWEAWAV
jgi:hypothetical protein